MSYDNPRITLDMSMQDIVVELCDGNPGAINTMMLMVIHAPAIDPDCAFGSLGPLLSLDTHDIYGSDIYVLYNDVCERNLVHTLALLRAVQLGFCGETELKVMIKQGFEVDRQRVSNLVAQVRVRLPNFRQHSNLE